MPDREKVIKGLKCIGGYMPMEANPCAECGYNECQTYAICVGEVARDVLELLREQEPVEPDGENCGECGYTLHRINYDGPDRGLRHEWFRFCPVCGKAVKWDAAD